jgi:hypothetical protein
MRFSIAAQVAWAPGLTAPADWDRWAQSPYHICKGDDAPVAWMAPMLRRRANSLGRMALEVAGRCADGRTGVPVVFCSRHGDVARAVTLLEELARDAQVSPTGFGLAVHNASAGLFSIARSDLSNHIALAAGRASVEHAVMEACGLLADGAAEVLLVVCDEPLPSPLDGFADCDEQPYAWAWRMTAPGDDAIEVGCAAAPPGAAASRASGGLEVLRFVLSGAPALERCTGAQQWTWTRA